MRAGDRLRHGFVIVREMKSGRRRAILRSSKAIRSEFEMMTRRTVGLGAVGAVAAGLGARLFGSTSEAKDDHVYPVSHSGGEWQQQLTPEQSRVLRQRGTERADTSPLTAEKRKGVFAC